MSRVGLPCRIFHFVPSSHTALGATSYLHHTHPDLEVDASPTPDHLCNADDARLGPGRPVALPSGSLRPCESAYTTHLDIGIWIIARIRSETQLRPLDTSSTEASPACLARLLDMDVDHESVNACQWHCSQDLSSNSTGNEAPVCGRREPAVRIVALAPDACPATYPP